MGLDQYLYRQPAGVNLATLATDDLYETDKDEWKRQYEQQKQLQVAYWRKANHIHKWFVDTCQGGVDECQYSEPISREALAGLVNRCRRILDGEDPEKLLPTQSGFFFGGTEYDEWYHHDLEDTIKQIEPLLSERNNDSFVYRSSW